MRAVVKNQQGEIVLDTTGDTAGVGADVGNELAELIEALPDSAAGPEGETTEYVVVVSH